MTQPEQQNQSEVAQLLAQIEAEYQAAQRGLTGLATGANHAAINARLARLQAIVGSDAAIRLLSEKLENIPNQLNEENDS